MSRIGKLPIAVPAGVTVTISEDNHVAVKGPKGSLERQLAPELSITQEGEEIIVKRPKEKQGTSRSEQNTYSQHGSRCYKRIREGSRS